uniref:Uncharacterized protein n=1 Tax=Arundo donax TaxID=35708 RepID=A0A0A9EIR8_ARUDO
MLLQITQQILSSFSILCFQCLSFEFCLNFV